MPIYEYHCQKCEEVFELLFKRLPEPNWTPKCIYCTSKYTEKKPSKTTFRLNGGGWADEGYSK